MDSWGTSKMEAEIDISNTKLWLSVTAMAGDFHLDLCNLQSEFVVKALTEEVVYNDKSCKAWLSRFWRNASRKKQETLGFSGRIQEMPRIPITKRCINLRPISIGTSLPDMVLIVIQSETRKYLKCDNFCIFSNFEERFKIQIHSDIIDIILVATSNWTTWCQWSNWIFLIWRDLPRWVELGTLFYNHLLSKSYFI